MGLPASIAVREVGPRDGLQAEQPVPVEARVALVEQLVAAGAREIEAASLVSPKAVPSMAGGGDVLRSIERAPGVRYWALVPNLRGAELALEAEADALTVTLSASAAYNEKNVRMTIDESVAEVGRICDAAGGTVVDAVISCAFGAPYEGDIEPATVAGLAARVRDVGCGRITLADTTGMATPRRVAEVVALTGSDVGLHLHDTRGTALVNAYAAMELGIGRFDTAVGGLGGSPFAAGAAGNLATEDLVHLCDDMGIATGIDLGSLLAVASRLADVIGHQVPSRLAAAGPRSARAVV